jgi:hypothetical protein
VARQGWPDGGGRMGVAGRGGQTGPDGVPDRARQSARRDGGRMDYLLLKEKMTCSIYVSCKSSSASDVSDTGWM